MPAAFFRNFIFGFGIKIITEIVSKFSSIPSTLLKKLLQTLRIINAIFFIFLFLNYSSAFAETNPSVPFPKLEIFLF